MQTDSLVCNLPPDVPSADLISSIFVLSAIAPEKHAAVALAIASVCHEGSLLLFRDYAVNDMAMVRFKPGAKIAL